MPVFCTPDEIKFIQDNKGKLSMYRIAKILGKSVTCVFKHHHKKVDLQNIKQNKPSHLQRKNRKPKIVSFDTNGYFDVDKYAKTII